MAKVVLSPGEQISVTFADTDGEIIVAFNDTAIEVFADSPDSTGRGGCIYREPYTSFADENEREPEVSQIGVQPDADAAALVSAGALARDLVEEDELERYAKTRRRRRVREAEKPEDDTPSLDDSFHRHEMDTD